MTDRREGENTTPYIAALQPIKRYEGPQWLVEPLERLSPDDERQTIMDIGPFFDVIESTIAGWGDYNAIIQYEDDWSWFHHYLARIEEV